MKCSLNAGLSSWVRCWQLLYVSSFWFSCEFTSFSSSSVIQWCGFIILSVFNGLVKNFFCHFLSQETIKTKHPQLLSESKLYKTLQGGSNYSLFVILDTICFISVNLFLIVFVAAYCNFVSWNSKCQMVWRWRGLYCPCDRFTGT